MEHRDRSKRDRETLRQRDRGAYGMRDRGTEEQKVKGTYRHIGHRREVQRYTVTGEGRGRTEE